IGENIKHFLEPYKVPRYIVAKIRDVLLLQPKLLSGRNRNKISHHPEYERAYDLFKILSHVYNLDTQLNKWPKPSEIEKY
ncbi:MAG: hypothetical protein HRT89_15390, partial [Lentisphaeria bacterium]|nr:hypothetical protein [Lentisphaeria bacterium]